MKKLAFLPLALIMVFHAWHSYGQSPAQKRAQEFLHVMKVLSAEIPAGHDVRIDQWLLAPKAGAASYQRLVDGQRVIITPDVATQDDTLLQYAMDEDFDQLMQNKGLSQFASEKEQTGASMEATADSVIIQRLNAIPTSMQFTYNTQVRRLIEMYIEKRQQQVGLMAGLGKHYFPMFEEVLYQSGLPLELKYLPVIESALNPKAFSRAGASGLWQFMYSTGKMYGLRVNTLVDERRDPLKSTHAAANYLKDLYGRYGDWMLVIAAYNCGPGHVNRAMRITGKSDFWDIYHYLPRETRGYVPAFVAAIYVMNYHEAHGISPVTFSYPERNEYVEIHRKLHFKQVAEKLDIPLETLEKLNPQYKYQIVPGTATATYSLNLPGEKSLDFMQQADSIYAYKDSIYLTSTRSKKVAPRSRGRSSYSYEAPDIKGKAKVYYTISTGDNMGFIAEWFDVRASHIRYWNNLRGNRIIAGKKLLIYVPEGKKDYYQSLAQMTFAEKQEATGNTTKAEKKASPGDNEFVYYQVRSGDNLWTIAKKFPGVSNLDIKQLNNFSSQQTQNLKPGDYIKIKRKSS